MSVDHGNGAVVLLDTIRKRLQVCIEDELRRAKAIGQLKGACGGLSLNLRLRDGGIQDYAFTIEGHDKLTI